MVVDDKLPVLVDASGQAKLLYCHNGQRGDEMWCALVEKAYAKLMTCYEYMSGGESTDALIDMTGGVHERIEIRSMRQTTTAAAAALATTTTTSISTLSSANSHKEQLWRKLLAHFEAYSMFTADIDEKDAARVAQITQTGLSIGHSYSILQIAELEPITSSTSEPIRLLK